MLRTYKTMNDLDMRLKRVLGGQDGEREQT